MKEKKSFAQRFDAFFNGKGFYIVLFVCMAVIGVSAWALLYSDSGLVGGDVPVMQAATGTEDGLSVFAGGSDDEVDAGADSVETGVEVSEPVLKAETAPVPKAEATQKPKQVTIKEDSLDELVFVWPVSGKISMSYSVDYPVFNKTMADWRTHDGVDIEAELGTRVLAIASGTVTEIFDDPMYGTTVKLDHGSGLISVYSNLAATPSVRVGDSVTTASVIGAVGDTSLAEASEPAHLHLSMALSGESVDPVSYLPDN